MKKLISLALCSVAILAANAQNATVEQAKKLAGKTDKIEEARSLIKEALSNPETANQAVTLYTAGKIEWDAYEKNQAVQMVDPQKVNPVEMGRELLNGYNYFIQVFPLDQLPNEKGEVKPKYTKELQKKIAGKLNDFSNSAVSFYNEKLYYPEAYNAFMIAGDIPGLEELGNQRPVVIDTIRALNYFNAGISAWSGNNVEEAAIAFRKAAENNYSDSQAYVYQIACWQNIEQNDSTREKEARENIFAAAKSGYDKFGMSQPLFLNNMVNSLVNESKENEAIELVNDALSKNPENAGLYGLRGYIYDRLDNEENSEADYRRAAELPGVDYETLSNVVKKLIRIGQNKWNNIELGDPDSRAKKQNVRTNYFEAAKKYAEKAKTLTDNPGDMDYLIENIDYLLSL